MRGFRSASLPALLEAPLPPSPTSTAPLGDRSCSDSYLKLLRNNGKDDKAEKSVLSSGPRSDLSTSSSAFLSRSCILQGRVQRGLIKELGSIKSLLKEIDRIREQDSPRARRLFQEAKAHYKQLRVELEEDRVRAKSRPPERILKPTHKEKGEEDTKRAAAALVLLPNEIHPYTRNRDYNILHVLARDFLDKKTKGEVIAPLEDRNGVKALPYLTGRELCIARTVPRVNPKERESYQEKQWNYGRLGMGGDITMTPNSEYRSCFQDTRDVDATGKRLQQVYLEKMQARGREPKYVDCPPVLKATKEVDRDAQQVRKRLGLKNPTAGAAPGRWGLTPSWMHGAAPAWKVPRSEYRGAFADWEVQRSKMQSRVDAADIARVDGREVPVGHRELEKAWAGVDTVL